MSWEKYLVLTIWKSAAAQQFFKSAHFPSLLLRAIDRGIAHQQDAKAEGGGNGQQADPGHGIGEGAVATCAEDTGHDKGIEKGRSRKPHLKHKAAHRALDEMVAEAG